MPKSNKTPTPPAKRMADYRARMRAKGLRPVQIWMPDTKDPAFIAECKRQAEAIAAHDPAGDDLMDFVEKVEQVHETYTTHPVIAGNHFAVGRTFDITTEDFGRIKIEEIMLYEVKDGQIVLEQFFY